MGADSEIGHDDLRKFVTVLQSVAGGMKSTESNWTSKLSEMHAATLGGKAAGTARCVAARELVIEFMLNALRLRAGFARAWLFERAGIQAGDVDALIAAACARGWLRDDGVCCVPTELGFRFLNDLQLLFTPEPADEASCRA